MKRIGLFLVIVVFIVALFINENVGSCEKRSCLSFKNDTLFTGIINDSILYCFGKETDSTFSVFYGNNYNYRSKNTYPILGAEPYLYYVNKSYIAMHQSTGCNNRYEVFLPLNSNNIEVYIAMPLCVSSEYSIVAYLKHLDYTDNIQICLKNLLTLKDICQEFWLCETADQDLCIDTVYFQENNFIIIADNKKYTMDFSAIIEE